MKKILLTTATGLLFSLLAPAVVSAQAVSAQAVSAQAVSAQAVSAQAVSAARTAAPSKSCPVGQVLRTTAKGKVCTKVATAPYAVYKGPVVSGKLPFPSRLTPGLSNARIVAEFAKDAAAINNCASGLFDSCARKVWDRRDPWNMLVEGRHSAYEVPWVKLFAKYAAAGVVVSHDLGDAFPGRYTNLDPVFAGTYRLDLPGGEIAWVEYETASGSSDRARWLVPGCRLCSRYTIVAP
jgi:hypothetical protein